MLIHDTDIWHLRGGDRRKLPIVSAACPHSSPAEAKQMQDVRGAEAARGRVRVRVCVCTLTPHCGGAGRRGGKQGKRGGGGSEFGFLWLLGSWLMGSSEVKLSVPLPRAGRLTAPLSPRPSHGQTCAGGCEQDSPVYGSLKCSNSFPNQKIPPHVSPESPEFQAQPVSSSVPAGAGRVRAPPHIGGAGTPALGWTPQGTKLCSWDLGVGSKG